MSAPVDAKNVLAEALGLAVDQIDESTALFSTAEWNSLAHLRLILSIEDYLSRRLLPQEIVGLSNFAAIQLLFANDP